MKSVHNLDVSKKDKEKMLVVGTNTAPVTTYTKDDFLSPSQVAKKFNISTDEASDIMKKINFKRAVFGLNGHKTPVIVRLGNTTLRLHPMATSVFQEYIDKQKAK